MSGRTSMWCALMTCSCIAMRASSFAYGPVAYTPVLWGRPCSSSLAARRRRCSRRLTVRAYDASGGTQLPIATYQLAGLYNCVMSESDGTVTPSRVFLRPGGTFDFITPTADEATPGDDIGGDEEATEKSDGVAREAVPDASLTVGYRGNVAGHGYWAILSTDEIELAVPQKGGGAAITYIGRVDGDKIGAADDDGSEIVRISGRVEEGDVDPEYIGSFSMVRTMSAFTSEQLTAENARRRVIAARKSALPVYVRQQLAGKWRLTADFDGSPLILILDLDGATGDFESVASEGEVGDGTVPAKYLGGRFGVYNPGDQSQDPSREWRKGEGTHFWLWVRRKASKGFALDADLRFLGSVEPSAFTPVEDELSLYRQNDRDQTSSSSPRAVADVEGDSEEEEEVEVAASSGGANGPSGPSGPSGEAPGPAEVAIKGYIVHGDIPDMEYSVCVGNFNLLRCSDEGELM